MRLRLSENQQEAPDSLAECNWYNNQAGNQSLENLTNLDYDGLSITDPCLCWEQTEEFISRLAATIRL